MCKSALTIALTLVVVASLAAPLVRHYVGQAGKPDVPQIAPDQPNATVVCYLRSNFRCTACQNLETCSREIVQQRFAAEAVAGTVVWKAIDYQAPGNEHYLSDFRLPTGGVVLLEFQEGKLVRWKSLLHGWNLTDDRKALTDYLESAIRRFHEEGR